MCLYALLVMYAKVLCDLFVFFVIARVMFSPFNVFVCLDSELLCDDAWFVCWLLLLLFL